MELGTKMLQMGPWRTNLKAGPVEAASKSSEEFFGRDNKDPYGHKLLED